MLQKIELKGLLAEKVGKEFYLDVASIPEAVRAIGTQIPALFEILREGSYRIYKNTRNIGEEELGLVLAPMSTIIIEPVVAGSKNGGVGKAIIGAIILVAAIALAPVTAGGSLALGATAFAGISYGTVALFGASMLLGGIGLMLSPVPKVSSYESRESPEKRSSFLFNGAQNTTEQGVPIPLVYGRMRTGSVIVSTGLSVEDINA